MNLQMCCFMQNMHPSIAMDWLFVLLPNFICWSPKLHCYDIRGRTWEVLIIRLRWWHAGSVPMMELLSLFEKKLTWELTLTPRWGFSEGTVTKHQIYQHFDFWLPASRAVTENICCLNIQYMLAQADKDTRFVGEINLYF